MKKLIYSFVMAALVVSCNPADKAAETKTTVMKEKMQGFIDEVINAHNVDMIDSYCTADFINHNPDPGHDGKGIEDLKATFRDFFTMFPDVHATTNYMIAEGDKVMAHMTMAGTNSGSMPNMPATNKSFSIQGIDVVTIKDGKASERWGFFDSMKMMVQLGMMPEHGAAPDSAMVKTEEKK